MRRRVFLGFLGLLALFAAIGGTAAPALAQGRFAHDRYYYNVQPLQQILPGIRRGYPGRFYDAEGPYPDAVGGLHYRIKWMTPDGRIIWLDADARTGRVIGPAAGGWGGPPAPPAPYGYAGPRGGNFGYGAPIMGRRPFPVGPDRGGWRRGHP
ncbi:MAG: hypothetical protein ABSC92_08670 [Rhizomicrobium sp.]|jgi:hypothetical protein